MIRRIISSVFNELKPCIIVENEPGVEARYSPGYCTCSITFLKKSRGLAVFHKCSRVDAGRSTPFNDYCSILLRVLVTADFACSSI